MFDWTWYSLANAPEVTKSVVNTCVEDTAGSSLLLGNNSSGLGFGIVVIACEAGK